MPTLGEFLASRQTAQPSASPLGQFLAQRQQARPGFFSRLGTQAQDRAADIGNFLLPGQPFDEAAVAAESLPEAESFSEKAADVIGHTLPDLGIGIGLGATGIGAAGAAGLGLAARTATGFGPTLARLGVESAVLAPLEYGTRPAGEATAVTLAGPVAGATIGKGLQLAGKGISSLLGRGGAEAASQLGKEIDLSDFIALRKLGQQNRIDALGDAAPRVTEEARPQFSENVMRFAQEDLFKTAGAKPPAQILKDAIKRTKMEEAVAAGRAVPLSDIAALGDDAAQREALDSLSEGSRLIKDILDDERDMLEVFKSMQRMPPEGVRDIAEAAEGLAGDKAKAFLKRMKGKGACPI